MAKEQPEDDFTFHVYKVAKERAGDFMQMCIRNGFTDVVPELVTTIRSYKRNAAPVDGISNEAFVLEWLKEHPTFKAIEVKRLLIESGRSSNGTAAYPLLSKLVDDKVLKALGGGNYARADVKHLAAPKKANAKKGTGPSARYAVSHGDTILKFGAKQVGGFTSLQVKKHFDKVGRPSGSVSTALHDLVAQKKIKRTDEGVYELIAAKTNGVDHAEVAAHG